jgi:hypothetical protein
MTKLLSILFELVFIKKDTLATIQALIAPVFIPLAPAVLLGGEVYKALQVNTVHWLALTAAVASAIGVEAVGGLSSYTAVLKAQRKQWGSVILASLVVAMYIAALVVAMWWFNAPALGVFAILTPSAFIIAALFNVDGVARQESEQQTTTQIELIKAQKNLVNAETRQIKAGALDMSVIKGNVPQMSQDVPQMSQDVPLSPKDKAIQMWLNGETNKSEIGRQVGKNRKTIDRWLTEAGLNDKQ